MPSINDTKALSLYDNHLLHISISLPDNHLHTNNQLINLLYNFIKNLSSILNCYIGPKCVASKNNTKPLSLCDNHFVFERNIL